MRWTPMPLPELTTLRSELHDHTAAPRPYAPAVVWTALVIGSVLIAATLRLPRGSTGFYLAGFALAAVWVSGAAASGPIRFVGRAMPWANQLAIGVVLGGLTFALFLGGADIARRISVLAGPIENVLGKADAGSLAAVLTLALVNAVAEELFFRGALLEVLAARHALFVSIVIYIAVTAVAGNTALAVAALVMGVIFAIERLITGSVLASIVTHVTWSTLIILFLPR